MLGISGPHQAQAPHTPPPNNPQQKAPWAPVQTPNPQPITAGALSAVCKQLFA